MAESRKRHNAFRSGIAALFVVATLSETGVGQTIWFTEDFHHQTLGSDWKSVTGTWAVRDGILAIETKEYDQLLVAPPYLFGYTPYSIETTLRGPRAGVYFSLDDTASKALSHMVRFDDKTLLTGYFNGRGEFIATSTFELQQATTEWTNLQVNVDPPHHRYTVSVNGHTVGEDTTLVFPSGRAGLQASDGRSEFRSFTITGEAPQEEPPSLQAGEIPQLRHIRTVSKSGGGVKIYDRERKSFLFLDDDGTLTKATPSQRGEPSSNTRTIFGNRRYSIEGKTLVIRTREGDLVDSVIQRLVNPAAVVVTSDSTVYIADPGANAVFLFGRDGEFLREYTARSIGGFKAPRDMELYRHDQLAVTDYDRLVLVPTSLNDPAPTVVNESPTNVLIRWPSGATRGIEFAPGGDENSGKPQPGSLLVTEDGRDQGLHQAELSPDWTVYQFRLTDLRPLRRYSFKVSPVYGTIPPSSAFSDEYRFTTLPDDSLALAFTRLPVMCMVYRTISYRDRYPADRFPAIPDGRRMTGEEIEYLRAACRFNSTFYFRNSGCRLMLDFDFHVVEDTLYLGDVGDKDPYWLSLTDRVTRDFEHAAAAFGKEPEEYCGLIVPYAWVNYPPRRTSAMRDPMKTDSTNIRQMYGGGTFGVPAPWKYGNTAGYTGNPFQDRFSRQDWLITHEFHHQIDALLEASGYPGYYHADQPWKMPGRFGEDFDFNARIIRNAGPEWWLGLKFGILSRTRDADRDGVPDNDRSLPFDELRLFGDTTLTDTDGDGLTDLMETTAGSEHGTAPNVQDTDGDHLNDGVDPEPLYPFPPVVHRISREHSPLIERVAANEFARLDSTTVFHLAWDDSSLFAGYTRKGNLSDTVGFLFQIDAANDGWFHGFDNTQIRIRRTGDSTTVVDYYLRDCSSWSDPPGDRKDILSTSNLPVVSLTRPLPDGSSSLTLVAKIPRNSGYGLDLVPGKRMSLRMGIQTSDDRWVWKELFERNYMMTVELTDTP